MSEKYHAEIARRHNLIKLDDDECVVCYEKTNYKASCNHSVCRECTSRIDNYRECPYCRQIRTDFSMCESCRTIKDVLVCGHVICSFYCPIYLSNLCTRCMRFRVNNICALCDGHCICERFFCVICKELKTVCKCINFNFLID